MPAFSFAPVTFTTIHLSADRQVALQHYRVFFAALMFLVVVATLVISLKPWDRETLSPKMGLSV